MAVASAIMPLNRRHFLAIASLISARLATGTPSPSWRTYRVRTQVSVLQPAGTTRVWIPVPLSQKTPFQQRVSNSFRCQSGDARVVKNIGGVDMVAAEFPSGVKPQLSVISEVKTRDWTVNIGNQDHARAHPDSNLDQYLRPTKMLPTDGIVKERAQQITNAAQSDVEKARAIYEWIVENTYRNPKTKGCGLGDIRFMLESGDLGGKCADLNALFVGLARASGLSARDVYGIRTGPSQRGYKSLGASSQDVTKAQHCRAEVYLTAYGWVPVDPADVRKVMLEEPPGPRPLNDELVKQARRQSFGSWEMNWMAYNSAQDVTLPGSSGPPLHYFMYPQAETAEGRLDSFDPASFQYTITSVELGI